MKLTRSLLITAAAGLALSAVATNSASAVPAPGSGCAAVHVITARASTEGAGRRHHRRPGHPDRERGASLNVHLTYLNRYQNAAASFVLSRIGG